jgi:predicted Zn-dependent protease
VKKKSKKKRKDMNGIGREKLEKCTASWIRNEDLSCKTGTPQRRHRSATYIKTKQLADHTYISQSIFPQPDRI